MKAKKSAKKASKFVGFIVKNLPYNLAKSLFNRGKSVGFTCKSVYPYAQYEDKESGRFDELVAFYKERFGMDEDEELIFRYKQAL